MHVGVIGNRKSISESVVGKILDEIFDKDDVLVSGGAFGVDSHAVVWARRNGVRFLIFHPNGRMYENEIGRAPPNCYSRSEYFKRNGLIAEKSDRIIAFIRRYNMRSGTWNTIHQFVKSGKDDFFVYDEDGDVWLWDLYPYYIKRALRSDVFCRGL
ncbi:MAG: SLOG family protein [Promethearchaeota archaeon]